MIHVDLHKVFDHKGDENIFHFKFSLAEDQVIAIYGPSGAGKSTLLRMIAGLDQAGTGVINVGGTTWFDSHNGVNLKPQERNLGMVFQHPSLFPTMTLRKNIEFAAAGKTKTMAALVKVMELEPLLDKYPHMLSGGEQQRGALARALVRKPEMLLLDEPLSALDTEMREKLQDEILELTRDQGITTLLVSHDRYEVDKMADQVILLREGFTRLEQS